MPKITATIHLRTREEVLDLIDELKRALKRSESSGGAYYASMEDTDAKAIFKVWVPVVPRIRLSRKGA